MRYVFPDSITDPLLARALPREALIRSLGMVWLHDGRGTYWCAGSGAGMTAADLLEHGPLTVEWLPPIPEDEQVNVLRNHILRALQDGRNEPHEVLKDFPASLKSFNLSGPAQERARADMLITLKEVTWIDPLLAELDVTREEAHKLIWAESFERVKAAQEIRRAGRPVTGTPTPIPESAEEEPRLPSIRAGVGFKYREKSTGQLWEILGLRSKRRLCLARDPNGPARDVRDHMPLDVLDAEYEFVDCCDHEDYCCDIHKTHTMPHKGCLMR